MHSALFSSVYTQVLSNNSHAISNFADTDERPKQTAEVKYSALILNKDDAKQRSEIFAENIMYRSIAGQFY